MAKSLVHRLSTMPHAHVKDEEALTRKILAIASDGIETFQVITDFDLTLSRMWVEAKKNKDSAESHHQRGLSSHGVFESYGGFSKEYIDEAHALFEKYHPIETDPSIPFAEKKAAMDEWWKVSHELMLSLDCSEATMKQCMQEALDLRRIALRDCAGDLVNLCRHNEVPFTILSAGLGNVIAELLREEGLLKAEEDALATASSSAVHIVSNRLVFDRALGGKLVGFQDPMVHSLTKKSALKSALLENSRAAVRGNCLVMGDLITDVDFVQSVPHLHTALTVGFLSDPQKTDALLEQYMTNFDIVLTEDASMEVPLNLVAIVEWASRPAC